MNWYYERAGQPVGPVAEEAIQGLRASGELGPQSRIWREDWPDWKTVGQAWPGVGGVTPGAGGLVACVECGKLDANTVEISGLRVCPTCQPLAIAKLREGIPMGGGPWREGKQVVVCKDVPLPERCLKCGEPPTKVVKKRLYWHHPLVYLALIPSVLIYIIVAMCVRKTMVLGVPLCKTCSGRRWRNIAIAWGLFLASVALVVLAANQPSSSSLGPIFGFSALGVFLLMLFWILGTRLIFPKKINDRYGWISKAGRPYLDSLPQWPGL